MVKALLDTDILSEYLKGHNKAVANHAASYALEHGVFTCQIASLPALRFGLLRFAY